MQDSVRWEGLAWPRRKAVFLTHCFFSEQKDMIPAHYAALKDHDEIVELFFTVKPDTMTQVNAVSFLKKEKKRFRMAGVFV